MLNSARLLCEAQERDENLQGDRADARKPDVVRMKFIYTEHGFFTKYKRRPNTAVGMKRLYNPEFRLEPLTDGVGGLLFGSSFFVYDVKVATRLACCCNYR